MICHALPLALGRPGDVHAAFHADAIQLIATRYASESFEVAVHFVERDGVEFPVIEVPAGVRTPVAAKCDLFDGPQPLIRKDALFVRSLNSSGVVASTPAGWKDWPRLVEVCFDNREADIGRFLRRHLSGASAEAIREFLSELPSTKPQKSPKTPKARNRSGKVRRRVPVEKPRKSASVSDVSVGPQIPVEKAKPAFPGQLDAILDRGFARFNIVVADRKVVLPPHGWWEIAAMVRGAPPATINDLSARDALLSSNPNLTGWPAWVDSRNFSTASFRPYFVDTDETREAFIDSMDGNVSDHLDFWRLSRRGEFYLYREFQDDNPSGPQRPRKPFAEFDFGLPILRTAEVLAVGMAFARALGAPTESASVAFEFRWNRLKGRELSAWVFPERIPTPGRRAYRDTVSASIDVPLNTPQSALHTVVEEVTAPLYAAFDNFQVPASVVEELVTRLLQRRW